MIFDKIFSPHKSETLPQKFEPVAAIVPIFGKGTSHVPSDKDLRGKIAMLAFSLSPDSVAKLGDFSGISQIDLTDRVVQYIRTEDQIIRINPDGAVVILDLVQKEFFELGHVKGGEEVKLGNLFTAAFHYSDPDPEGFDSYAKFTTYTPVQEYLVRTSREIKDVGNINLPTTDTPVRAVLISQTQLSPAQHR